MNRVPLFAIYALILASLIRGDACSARGFTTPARQSQEQPEKESDVTRAAFEGLQSRVQNSELKTGDAENCQKLLKQIETNLGSIEADKKEAETNLANSQTAEERAEQLRSQLETLKKDLAENADQPAIVPEGTSVSGAHDQAKLDLQSLQKQLTAATRQSTDRLNRIIQIRTAISTANKKVQDAQERLREPPAENESPLVTECRVMQARSDVEAGETEISKLQSEIQWYEASQLASVNTARIELLNAKITVQEKVVADLGAQLEQDREKRTSIIIKQATQDVLSAPKPLKPFAQETAAIANQASNILNPLADATKREEQVAADLTQLRSQVDITKSRIRQPGSPGSTGSYLRRQLISLPRSSFVRQTDQEQAEIDSTLDLLFRDRDARQKLLAAGLPTTLSQAIASAPENERAALKNRAEKMVQLRKNLLDQSISNYESYIDTLSKINAEELVLRNEIDDFRDYINERILWIKSNKLLFSQLELDDSARKILDSKQWGMAGRGLADDVWKNPALYIIVTLTTVILLWRRNRIKKRIRDYGEVVSRGSVTSFTPTWKATLLTFATSAALPLLMVFIGWRLIIAAPEKSIAIAIGRALFAAAQLYFPLEFVRKSCRPYGLAERHFRWSGDAIEKIKKQLDWFVPLGTALMFFFALFYIYDMDHRHDVIERVVYLLLLIAVLIVLVRLFHPEKGIFQQTFDGRPDWWVTRTKWIWYYGLLLLPFSLIVMVVYGYYYSAIQMISRVYISLIALLSVEFSRALIARFVSLSQRKAQIEQAKQRYRQLTGAATSSQPESERTEEAEAMIAEESRVVLEENVQRSRKMIRACALIGWVVSLWIIWIDVVPALKGLDRYVLWETTMTVSEAESPKVSISPAGTPVIDSTDSAKNDNGKTATEKKIIKPITLRHLLIAVFVLAITVFFVQNLPGFLELLFLSYLPVEPSLRYAFKTIASYVILLIGIVIAGRILSIGWSQIQWLATALTFGLAFGLQEIFANFIAGIILLLERPIRIGDTISVDNVTGTVTKIRIRATTIMDWDRKEYIVPNKEFITGRVLNWTLTDQINRLTLNIGIAYGSDVSRAKEILLEICTAHPKVVQDPGTLVTFEDFGDSTLNLVVRTFLTDYSSRLPTRDELLSQINDQFNEAGIEIAFPQQDLHIRSMPNGPSEDRDSKTT